jgi:glucose/arabinose dehydrogenase/mono/diheme cytochrome c family protein
MWFSSLWRVGLGSLYLGSLLVTAQVPPRVPNTTLQFPSSPPAHGYRTTNAFPGLTFNQPLAIASPPGETNRLFIVEKGGRIQVIPDLANPTQLLFLDLSTRVLTWLEGGLLGIAFHPGYATNRLFFVVYSLYTTTERGTGFHVRLSRFEVSEEDPNRALPNSEVPMMTQFHRNANHNGGDLHFGPDGFLYVSLGDEGGSGDPFFNSRVIDRDLFCAIIRIDVDQRPGSLPPNPHPSVHGNYWIPSDNPFVGATRFDGRDIDPNQVRTEFWAVGLRNPWRFTFDSATGRMFCADVGQNAREEVNVIERGGNYGWNYREGMLPFNGSPPPDAHLIDPILDYPHQGDSSYRGNSITGGVVYRGDRLSQLYGDYIFADYGSGNIWALGYDGTAVTHWTRITSGSGIVAFGHDPATADVLFAQIGNGQIRRLIAAAENTGDPLPPTLADTGAFADLATLTPQPGIVPYGINAPFWSDHATKTRWFSLPNLEATFGFDPTTNWTLPAGAVWIKHFDLDLVRGDPSSRRRLETRFLIRNDDGVYGLTYRWDDAQASAYLVPEEGLNEAFEIEEDGTMRIQMWRYPSRSECLACHTPQGGLALGFNTFQLNRDHLYADTNINQLLALSEMGYFSEPIEAIDNLAAMVHPTNPAEPLELRVRSHLAANCSQCHQPGGLALGTWDARFSTPLDETGLIEGSLVNDRGHPDHRVIKPGSIEESMIWQRIRALGPGHMPPLATFELDHESIALFELWINRLTPGPRVQVVLAPDGQIELRFPGVQGQVYRIEYSALLDEWETLESIEPDPEGQVIFRDPVSDHDNATRFYRIVTP